MAAMLSKLLGPVILGLLLLSGADPAFAQPLSADGLLNRYYDQRAHNEAVARTALSEAKRLFPADPRAFLEAGYLAMDRQEWAEALQNFEVAARLLPLRADLRAQAGYLQLRLGRADEALASFRNAAELAPEHEEYRLQKAYLEDQFGQRSRALEDFHRVAVAGGAKAEQACGAWHALRSQRDGLPSPWFSEVYLAPEWRRHQAVSVVPAEARVGATIEAEHQVELYGSLRATWDNRSGRSDLGPLVFFDDAAIVAAGIRGRPFPDLPVTAFVEAGIAHDLSDRDRDADRGDMRGGLLLYQDWNMTPGCGEGWRMPLRFVADIYGELIRFSRYGDTIGSLRLRPGFRLAESDDAGVDGYLLLNGGIDSENIAGNRYREAGLGLALKFFDTLPLTMRGEAVQVWRVSDDRYSDLRLRAEYFVRF